jgi:hypothetical protein
MTQLQPTFADHVHRMNQAYYDLADRVMTLSTGSLALSITFRRSFSSAASHNLWLLRTSWISFVLAVLLALILLGAKAVIAKNTVSAIERTKQPSKLIVRPPWWFRPTGYGMFISFLVGVSTFVAFAITNAE